MKPEWHKLKPETVSPEQYIAWLLEKRVPAQSSFMHNAERVGVLTAPDAACMQVEKHTLMQLI